MNCGTGPELRVWLGLRKTDDALVCFPLAALLEKLNAFKALQNVAFYRNGAGTLKTAMLRHGKWSVEIFTR